jgi:hypothetical protein
MHWQVSRLTPVITITSSLDHFVTITPSPRHLVTS